MKDVIKDAIFVSMWEEGTVETHCKVNMVTREVFDIEQSNDDIVEILNNLICEYICFDDIECPVFRIDNEEATETDFWYK